MDKEETFHFGKKKYLNVRAVSRIYKKKMLPGKIRRIQEKKIAFKKISSNLSSVYTCLLSLVSNSFHHSLNCYIIGGKGLKTR